MKCNPQLEKEVLLTAAFWVVFLIQFHRKVQLISGTALHFMNKESEKKHEREQEKALHIFALHCFPKLTASNPDSNPQTKTSLVQSKKRLSEWIHLLLSHIAELHSLHGCVLQGTELQILIKVTFPLLPRGNFRKLTYVMCGATVII